MHSFTAFTAVFLSLVGAFIVPRATQPDDWSNSLEPYSTYHARYLKFGCETEHNTQFFAECCKPLLGTQTVDVLPPGCNSGDVEDDGEEDCASTTADGPGPTAAVTSTQSTGTSTPNRVASIQNTTSSTKSSTSFNEGGVLTYFLQGGNAGACGTVHSDWDLICALDSAIYNNGASCGRQILIQALGKSVTVTVADECPTCENANSLDLSEGAFLKIADLSVGVVQAEWKFLD